MRTAGRRLSRSRWRRRRWRPRERRTTAFRPEHWCLRTPAAIRSAAGSYISNSTDHALTVTELSEPFDARLADGEPQILILHTHGSEAYTPPPGTDIVWSGNYRTTDSRYNVVGVG